MKKIDMFNYINILIKNLKNKIKIINKTNVVENFQNNKFMKVLTKIEELRDLILNGITKEELDNNYDYSQITDMSYMFSNYKSLKEIPLIDTKNVTNMVGMFEGCKNLKTIPLLNTSNVKYMDSMFSNCTLLKEIPLLDTSNVLNMKNMFFNCINLENKPNFDMSKVENKENMFYGCTTIEKKELDIENKRMKEKLSKDENDLIKELNKTTIDLPNLIF